MTAVTAVVRDGACGSRRLRVAAHVISDDDFAAFVAAAGEPEPDSERGRVEVRGAQRKHP